MSSYFQDEKRKQQHITMEQRLSGGSRRKWNRAISEGPHTNRSKSWRITGIRKRWESLLQGIPSTSTAYTFKIHGLTNLCRGIQRLTCHSVTLGWFTHACVYFDCLWFNTQVSMSLIGLDKTASGTSASHGQDCMVFSYLSEVLPPFQRVVTRLTQLSQLKKLCKDHTGQDGIVVLE